MRLARRALVAALAMLMLCAVASAQTLRQENDPRNLSPSVGTGGPEGGPTGLFTIYDGQTLRRGEYTFSIAYSNYDRDPGNVDITEVPLSFNIGINDHLELFFKTTGYRGVHVNNPQNLSSFYLPNSQLKFPFLGSGPAIVLAPSGPNVGTLRGTAIFRPAFNQPFVQYPYTGGSAGTFGMGPGALGTLFGFPGFNATLGPPIVGTGGNFGAASTYPGVGSPVGSILPGIVLATATLPPTILDLPITVPVTFTVAPSYLPDAPFINRLYGQSTLDSFTVGAKWRLTGPNNPLGFGFIPMYRFYADKADDAGGFNMLQRGASAGGNVGDFGLVMFLDGRLSRSVNVSANLGYWLNSNPKGPANDVLLDRPDELIAGVGFDFPVNRYIQPVAELRSTQYVAGRTPNAFENSPVDVLGGVKIYPHRWLGIGLAYRYHINQQDQNMFKGRDFNTQINQTTNVFVPGRGIVVIPATTRPATAGGFPLGFVPSENANGFIIQAWAGKRNARAPQFLPNQPPVVSLAASSTVVNPPCPPGLIPRSGYSPGSETVSLSANATDPDGDTLLYTYSTTGGRISGEGPNTSWDLSGVGAGTYTATVEVDDGCGCVAFSSTTITVNRPECVPPCPTITVTCPTDVIQAGSPATVSVNVSGGDPNATYTYSWTVSAGTIASGQSSPSITIDTTGAGGQTITASVEIGGIDPSCPKKSDACSFQVGNRPECRKFDEYGDIRFNDEKARLDNYAIQLQNEPSTQGYIVAYGSCNGEAQRRADRAKDYLVTARGIDPGRITIIASDQCLDALTVELWICQQGAAAPAADHTDTHACVDCKPVRRGRARTGRRHRRGEEE